LNGLSFLAVVLGLSFHGPPARSDASATRKPKTTVWKRPADCDSFKIPIPPDPMPPNFDWAPLAADWCRYLARCSGYDTTGCARVYLDAVAHPITKPVLPLASDGGTKSSAGGTSSVMTCLDSENYWSGLDPCPAEDVDPDSLPRKFAMAVHPETRGARVRLALPVAGRVVLRIQDTAGRLVRRIETSPLEPGTFDCFWNGLNEKGAAVKGVYSLKVTCPSGTGSRVVILR
jgi:hypothetical protein